MATDIERRLNVITQVYSGNNIEYSNNIDMIRI